MRINLLSVTKPRTHWKRILLLALMAGLIVGLGIYHFNKLQRVKVLKYETVQLQKQLDILLAGKAEYLRLQKQAARLRESVLKEGSHTEETGVVLKETLSSGSIPTLWARLVREQGYLVPEKVMLESLKIQKGLTLTGIAASSLTVMQLIDNLESSPLLTDVQLKELKNQKNNLGEQLENYSEERQDVTFTITATITAGIKGEGESVE